MARTPAEIASAAGIVNADAVVEAARLAGLDLPVAFALVQMESGGKNIYGHDKGGVFSVAGEKPVTEANFAEFLRRVLAGETSNGVGPCQITYAGTVKNGRRDGGYFRQMLDRDLRPWHPVDNCRFGFELIAASKARHGSWPAAGAAYNGGTRPGERALAYGRRFAGLIDTWTTRLGKPDTEQETDVAEVLCPFARHRLIPAGSNDPRIRPRVAILHVDAGNAPSLYDFFKHRSGGIESHFHIAKDGTIEQYREVDRQADANHRANDFAVSIETQGYGEGEWTDAQLTSIKRLLLWLRDEHDIPLRKIQTWDGSGVGYHTLFGAPSNWTPVAKSCPGPDRKRQFERVLVPWMNDNPTTPTERDEFDMATPEDLREIVREEIAAAFGDRVTVPATESEDYRKAAGNGKVLVTSALTRVMHGIASLRKSRNEDRDLLVKIGEKVGLTPGE